MTGFCFARKILCKRLPSVLRFSRLKMGVDAMSRFSKLLAGAAVIVLFAQAVSAPAQATSYNLTNIPWASGTITTDGTLGVLSAGNITDWNINLFNVLTLSVYNSKATVEGTRLLATSLGLYFDFSPSPSQYQSFAINTTATPIDPGYMGPSYMQLVTEASQFTYQNNLTVFVGSGGAALSSLSGIMKIGTAAVPGPIAGAGLPALLGLFGILAARRRKAA